MSAELHHPTWMRDGACVDLPGDWWFPEGGNTGTRAIQICNTCAVQDTCLEYAITNGETMGIWGGKSARQRARMHKQTGAA